jgi:hypothetical protein
MFVAALAFAAGSGSIAAEDSQAPPLQPQPETSFVRDVAPFLKEFCVHCHGGDEPEAKLSLDRYGDSAKIQTDYEVWQKVLKMLSEGQMPPSDETQPNADQLKTVMGAIQAEMASFDCSGPKRPGRVTIRRLNRIEYNNTIRDLFGIDIDASAGFPSDDVGNGFDNIADVLTMSPILLEKYLAAADTVVTKAFESDEVRRRILAHGEDERAFRGDSARRNLAEFAERAFRRPVSEGEVRRLYDLTRLARDAGSPEDEAFQIAIQATLASPHFLFRIEQDPDPGGEPRRLDSFELATRLSYFLWSTMPDEELFECARTGSLRDPEVLRSQVRRMLAHANSQALVQNFGGQWLQLRSLRDMAPDPEMFPAFDEPLRQAMLHETELFFETIIRDDRSILDFLDADFTFVNERLARHYGIEGVAGDEFQRVALSDRRRGVLTQGSILLITSNPTRTSPVKRGKWILDNVLGEPPPPPPAGVEELEEQPELLGSLRERMEQHRANESCAVCHRTMDTLGFGLENFDVTGAWRDRDGRFEIDASGMLPGGGEFRGPKELMQILKTGKRDAFCRCLTEKLLTYALGRGLESYDRCAVDAIVSELEKSEFRFSALVTSIVLSDPFQFREARGEN